jgi:hypothetical protein
LEYSFNSAQFTVFAVGIAVCSVGLFKFPRGLSRIQPPATLAGTIRFIGGHTLGIYAIQLAGSEIFVYLLPDLVP